MAELEDSVQEITEHPPESRLNSVVAAAVALFATFMAICNIKDGNVVQAMAQAQARSYDAWAFYQGKGLKRHLAESLAAQLRTEEEIHGPLSPAGRKLIEERVAQYDKEAARYEAEQAEIKKQADGYQAEYDRLNRHDDQFDLAEACLSVAIALAGMTALTRKRWLLVPVFVLGGIGFFMGTAGLLGWSAHSDALARLLG